MVAASSPVRIGLGQSSRRPVAGSPGHRRRVRRRDRPDRACRTQVRDRPRIAGPSCPDRERVPDHRAARPRVAVGTERADGGSMPASGRRSRV